MSWDVVVFDFRGSPPPIEEWEGDSGAPLGSPEEVRRKIDAHLPGVDWSDSRNGIYDGDDFSFEFRLLEEESVENFLIAVRGSGDAVAALLQLATPHRWSLLDGSTSEWIDPANPSNAGWEGFQEFRDRALATMTAEDERAPEPSGVAEETGSSEERGPEVPADESVSEERDSEGSSAVQSVSESSVAGAGERPSGRKAAPRKKKKASTKKASTKKAAGKKKTGVKKAVKGKKKGATKKTAPKRKAAGKRKGAAQKKVARKKKAAAKKAAAKKAAPKKKKASAKSARKTAKKRVVKKKSAKKKRK